MFDTFERLQDLTSRKRLQCNECRRETIHTLEAQCRGLWSYADNQGNASDGGTDFSLYRCGACDVVCFEKSSWDSEARDPQDGEYETIDIQYPHPSSADFAFDTDFTPNELDELIEEMIYALSGGMLKLATVALRMVVEFIVRDKKCTGRNLQQKIADLHAKGHVSEAQLALLHKIREKGNAGAHERIAMTRKEMVAGIGIVNLLLEKLYNGPAREEAVVKRANQVFNGETTRSFTIRKPRSK